ncbi:MAG: trypsin-like peptidase domain-containing protein [Streptosporangiaceae bacterium]
MNTSRSMGTVGLDPDRAAEVIVGIVGQRLGQRGSGYRVRAGIVLTAAHVVGDESVLQVRFRADQLGAWTAEGRVVWLNTDIDVAVIAIAETGHASDQLPPVRFAYIEDSDGALTCSALGFPRYKLRSDLPAPEQQHASGDGGPVSVYRDYAHVTGSAMPWSNLREGTLSVSVPAPAPDPDPKRSPWEGMSGAALWSSGCCVGLIQAHHQSDGLGQLAASRVDRWYDRLNAAQLHELGILIGLPARDQLAAVGPPRSLNALQGESLEALLNAEQAASLVQPYQLQDRKSPQLDQVYIEQWAVELPQGRPDQGMRIEPRPLPAEEALTQHRHLVIEGGPGAGKSTFTQHVSRTLASAWLSGRAGVLDYPDRPPLPLRVPATHLAGDAPLASLLHASARARLAVRLTRDLPADLFQAQAENVPWLLLVDGLDEVADPAARERIIATIAASARRTDEPYRWVVTTRSLPPEELQPLWPAGLGHYLLRPFDDDQLRELAHRWLGQGDEEVNEFLRQADENGLRQLIRAPLLAALTLIVFRRREGRGLPSGRPGLYQEFVSNLLSGRGGEAERREAFKRAAVAVGAGTGPAEWLYQNRAALLKFLARQTMGSDASLLAEAVLWTEARTPELPEFIYGWPGIVQGLLAGTGLLSSDEGTGELHWLHRSFAEYLAARDAADELPADWPGQDPDADRLLRHAIWENSQILPVLTIACWAQDRRHTIGPLLDYLLSMSDDYAMHLKYHGGGIIMGDDSSRVDTYAALAGRLLAEGITVDEATSERVLNRLLERARSVFLALYFCAVIAAQPQRQIARHALLRMASDDSLPISVRADAIVTLGRIFGTASLRDIAEPLLSRAERTQFTMRTETGTMSATIEDGRALVAHRLASLGEGAKALVSEFLDNVTLPASDGWGRYLAAEAAVLAGEPDRAVSFLIPIPADEHGNISGEVSVLLSAGRSDAATALIDALFTSHEPDDRWSAKKFARDIEEIAAMGLRTGRISLATDIARRAIKDPSPEVKVAALKILARAGDPGAGIAFLASAEIRERDFRRPPGTSTDPQWVSCTDWIDLARVLWNEGYTREVVGAVDSMLGRTSFGSEDYSLLEMAEFLYEIGHPQGRPVLLQIAGNAGGSLRQNAAEYLLDTDDRQAGRDALVDLAQEGPTDAHDAVELVRTLLLIGAEDTAERLLQRIISSRPDTWNDRNDALELLCQLRPTEGRRVLLALVDANELDEREVQKAARNLLLLGEPAAARLLLRRQVFDQAHTPRSDLMTAGHMLAQAQDEPGAIAAFERVLHEAAADKGRSPKPAELRDLAEAASFLNSAGRFGERQRKELGLVATRSLKAMQAAQRRWEAASLDDERDTITLAQILAVNGAVSSAAELVALVIEARAGAGGAQPGTVEELHRFERLASE